MSKFKSKRGKSDPAISTASLPDIIFMLLFFFMMVTVLRKSEVKVEVTVPKATELSKLEKKSLVNYIYIGVPQKPQDKKLYGTGPQIQLGDKFANPSEIPLFIEQHKITIPEPQRPQITTSLRVDQKVNMGIIYDVKQELRKAGQLKLNYSANPRQEGERIQ
jgi:biopolymer transport protein ExbD